MKSWQGAPIGRVTLGGVFESRNDVSVLTSARLTEFCGDGARSHLQSGALGLAHTSLVLSPRGWGPVLDSGGPGIPAVHWTLPTPHRKARGFSVLPLGSLQL